MSNFFKIQAGQIYVAADGRKNGQVVLDVTTFIDRDDVVVLPLSAQSCLPLKADAATRIDTFKLAVAKYSLAKAKPAWLPFDTIEKDGCFCLPDEILEDLMSQWKNRAGPIGAHS